MEEHLYYNDDPVHSSGYQNTDTVLGSSLDPIDVNHLYYNAPFIHSFPVDSLEILKHDTIQMLNIEQGKPNDWYYAVATFTNLPVTHHLDTLICTLSGIDAARFIKNIYCFEKAMFSIPMINGSMGTASFFRKYNRCTDSTFIQIKFPYKP